MKDSFASLPAAAARRSWRDSYGVEVSLWGKQIVGLVQMYVVSWNQAPMQWASREAELPVLGRL